MSNLGRHVYWISDFFKSSVLEPTVLLHSFAGAVRAIAILQIIQDKVCIQEFEQHESYCRVLSSEEDCSLKDTILATVSKYTTLKELLVIVPGIITALFIGSWSDRFKNAKRYCLLSTSFARFLESFLLLFNAISMESPAYLVVASFLPPSLFGNEFGFYAALFAFIASNIKSSEKGMRYITISALGTIGTTVGSFLGGYIISKKPYFWDHQFQNYSGCFLVSAVFSAVCFLWILVFVREEPCCLLPRVHMNVKKEEISDSILTTSTSIESSSKSSAFEGKPLLGQNKTFSFSCIWLTLKEMLDYRNIRDVFTVITRRRQGSIRLRMWLMIITINLGFLPVFGKETVMFPLLQKLHKWDSVMISNLLSLQGCIQTIAIILIIPVLFKVIKANDCQTSMIGVVSEIIADVCMGSILSPCGFYLQALMSSLSGVTGTGARSYLSKILPKEEISKVFAATLVMQASLRVVGSFLFTYLLQLTMTIYPTFSFHFMVIILIVALIILVYVDINTRYPL